MLSSTAHDELEIHNLLQFKLPGFAAELNALLVQKAQRAVRQFLAADQLFCPRPSFCTSPLDQGVPAEEDESLAPFLRYDEYDRRIHDDHVALLAQEARSAASYVPDRQSLH